MKVLLTGYAGRLGRYVARTLKGEGHFIRVVLHSHTVPLSSFEQEVDEVLWGSLDDHALLTSAVQGIDCVIHCAWKFSKQGDPRPSVNEVVAQQLLERSIAAGVSHFAFISSIAVYGMRRAEKEALTEDSPLASGSELRFVYPSEKIDVENKLRSQAAHAIRLGIFRPGPIFDDSRSPVKKLVRFGSKAVGIGIGNGKNRMPHVHAQDVADAIIRWLKTDQQDAVFNVTPDSAQRQRQWYRSWGKVHGYSVIPLFIPPFFVRMAAWMATRLFRLLGRKKKINVDYAIACDKRDILYSNERARRDLGWEPAMTERFVR